jgi:hypothetical protein
MVKWAAFPVTILDDSSAMLPGWFTAPEGAPDHFNPS